MTARMNALVTAAALGFCLVLAGQMAPAFAAFEDAMRAVEEDNYPTAFRELLPLALAGHADAQFELGFLYMTGRGVIKDQAMAAKWWLLSAEQGHLPAAYNLSGLYREGPDQEGRGLEMDKSRAYMWLRLVIKVTDRDDLKNWAGGALAELVKEMTPEQIVGGRRLLAARLPPRKTSGMSFEDAGALYQSGDHAAAFTAFMSLAEGGDSAAQAMVASMYLHGDGTAENAELGAQWYRKAADAGNPPAQFNLASLYARGEGVKKDLGEAARLLRQAAVSGHTTAQFRLGFMLLTGSAGAKNLAEAAHWFRLSAEQGNGDAQLRLGYMYAQGEGLPRDLVRALMWLNISAAQKTDRAALMRDGLAELMTKEEVIEAGRRARNWSPGN
jgi:uncharacterized protein